MHSFVRQTLRLHVPSAACVILLLTKFIHDVELLLHSGKVILHKELPVFFACLRSVAAFSAIGFVLNSSRIAYSSNNLLVVPLIFVMFPNRDDVICRLFIARTLHSSTRTWSEINSVIANQRPKNERQEEKKHNNCLTKI